MRGRRRCLSRSIPARTRRAARPHVRDLLGIDDRSPSTSLPASAARTRTGSTCAPRHSAAATSASRAIPASCACAAATTRSTTAAPGKPTSRAAGRASRMTRTLFDDALQRGLRVPTSCRSHRPLPRVRRRGARRRSSTSRPRRRPSASCGRRTASPARRPWTIRRPRSSSRSLRRRLRIVAPERGMRIAGPIDPVVRRRRRRCALRRDAGRAAARRRLRRRRRPRHDDGRARARRPARRPHARGRRARESSALRRQRRDEPHQLRRGRWRRRAAQRGPAGAQPASSASSTSGRRSTAARSTRSWSSATATMRDLFFGLDVAPIGQRPYKSISELELIAGQRESTVLTHLAHELGVRAHPKARVWGGPLIASHVGADVAADLVAVGLDQPAPGIRMLVDVGTNTEVVLRGQRPHPGHELPRRPGVRGRLRHLRHAGRRGRDRIGRAGRRGRLRRFARSAMRPRSASAARG